MSKKGVIRCLLAILLAIYIAIVVVLANESLATQQCKGFDIRIVQVEGSRNFVTAKEIRRLLKEWHLDNIDRPASSVPLQQIEDKLNKIDNIESAIVERMPDNRIRLTIVPMIPVARVFDFSGHSYYINRNGKRLTANARYHLDVPVISGVFRTEKEAAALIPLVEYLRDDPQWNAITSQIMVDPRTKDIILVPLIRGHVVNLGDTADIPDKLSRVMTMYHKVMPLKGWEFYDTISVKWAGQVVATRREKSIPEPAIRFDQEGEVEEQDVNSMLVATDVDTTAVVH
jgi:cell division protein FtsQ